jgi:hypothetical protein
MCWRRTRRLWLKDMTPRSWCSRLSPEAILELGLEEVSLVQGLLDGTTLFALSRGSGRVPYVKRDAPGFHGSDLWRRFRCKSMKYNR